MKKNTAYTIGSLIILLICAFVFVILPAFTGSNGRNGSAPVFGKYKGTEIRYEQDSDLYNFASNYAQMYQNYGVQIDSSTHYYIMNYAFNSTVSKLAFEDAVKNSGYTVPTEAINRGMRPYFYDENGVYSSKIYKQTSDSTIQTLRKEIESNLVTQRFQDDIFGSETDVVGTDALYGLKESDAELDFLANLTTNARGFQMARFALSDYPEDEKVKFGAENAAKFNKYDISAIIVSDKSTAKTVSNRLANNEITFEDAVTEYSEKNYTNSEGKLTNKYQYQIENILTNKADLAKIIDLAVGSVSDPIDTNGTLTIFKMDSEKVSPDFTNEETLRTVSTYISTFESTMIEDYFADKAKKLKTLPGTFEEACASASAEFVTVAPFPLNYGSVPLAHSVNTSTSGLSNADTNEKFLKTAFSLKMNEVSDPIVMNNSVVVIKYTESETNEPSQTIGSDLETMDSDTVQNAIMDSPKLVNNFSSVYFKTFMNN